MSMKHECVFKPCACQVVCPTCKAAVGAKCTKKVKDGHQSIETLHPARIVAAIGTEVSKK